MAIDWSDLVLGPCIAIFGDTAQYTSQAGTFQITGIFDESYTPLQPLGAGGLPGVESFGWGSPGVITTGMPCLGVQLSQFSVPPLQGDTLIMTSGSWTRQTFYVKEVQPDSKGGAKLLLNLVNDFATQVP